MAPFGGMVRKLRNCHSRWIFEGISAVMGEGCKKQLCESFGGCWVHAVGVVPVKGTVGGWADFRGQDGS